MKTVFKPASNSRLERNGFRQYGSLFKLFYSAVVNLKHLFHINLIIEELNFAVKRILNVLDQKFIDGDF